MNQTNSQSPSCNRWSGAAILLATAAVGVALDLYTKHVAVQLFGDGQSEYQFLPGYLHFTFVPNDGAVFGLAKGARWVFVAVAIGALGFVAYLYRSGPRRIWYALTLGLLLGGILGNLYDRIFIGCVRDMIHAVPRWPNFFPWVFNLADSYLCVSIILLLITGMFGGKDRRGDRS